MKSLTGHWSDASRGGSGGRIGAIYCQKEESWNVYNNEEEQFRVSDSDYDDKTENKYFTDIHEEKKPTTIPTVPVVMAMVIRCYYVVSSCEKWTRDIPLSWMIILTGRCVTPAWSVYRDWLLYTDQSRYSDWSVYSNQSQKLYRRCAVSTKLLTAVRHKILCSARKCCPIRIMSREFWNGNKN